MAMLRSSCRFRPALARLNAAEHRPATLHTLLSDIAHATAFLTRLPVPSAAFGNRPLDFRSCAWAFPIAGVLGCLPAAFLVVSLPAGTSPFLLAVVAVLTTVVVTGALHEDGAADVADGFWGAHEPGRRLEVMRDSRIGTYGTLTLIGLILLKVAALASFTWAGVATIVAAVIGSTVVGKLALLAHWWSLPPARTEGLSERFGKPSAGGLFVAVGLGALIVLSLAVGTFGLRTIPALTLGLTFAVILTWLARRKVGGRTGDTLGATAIAAECGFLLGATLPILAL